MKKMLIAIGALVVIAVIVVAAAIAFGATPPPPAATAPAGYGGIDLAALPAIDRYRARDGVALGYRRYAPSETQTTAVVVLLHGVADSGPSLDVLARALRDAGVVSYVPEIRGHGDSGTPGDIAYIGQLDDDLVDLAAVIHQREGAVATGLIGFSAGGGLALRFAAGPHATTFTRYLLLAPGLSYRGPTVRPSDGDTSGIRSFMKPYVPRLIGLSIANAVGIHAFDGLPSFGFAVPPGSRTLSSTYSLRLLMNLMPHDYQQDIAVLTQPTAVIIGDADEFLVAAEVAKSFAPARPPVPVQILAGVSHIGVVTRPVALEAVKTWAVAR